MWRASGTKRASRSSLGTTRVPPGRTAARALVQAGAGAAGARSGPCRGRSGQVVRDAEGGQGLALGGEALQDGGAPDVADGFAFSGSVPFSPGHRTIERSGLTRQRFRRPSGSQDHAPACPAIGPLCHTLRTPRLWVASWGTRKHMETRCLAAGWATGRLESAGVVLMQHTAESGQDVFMPDTPALPSLKILLDQVASERETMNTHAESLDTKAGVILGFAGVLVGLGATAQATISTNGVFRSGLGVAVVAAVLAAWAVFPRSYPVLEVLRTRQKFLTAAESETQLQLLDVQIKMVMDAAELVKHKGSRVRWSVFCLAMAAALVVVGTLTAGGQADAGKRDQPRSSSYRSYATSAPTRTAPLQPGHGPDRLYREGPEAAR